MKSDMLLDYAIFQLSPRRSRCELFVSREGKTEKIASGLLKPFVSHLKVVADQFSQEVPTIELEVTRSENSSTWFTKGTLERFVRFVSTPEVLELVNTFDAEMSQLEAARRIYSQVQAGYTSDAIKENQVAAEDTTKRELLRAIDVRLVTVRNDLSMSCSRAAAAGFTVENVSELLMFADHFQAPRLSEACKKFISLCKRRPEVCPWKKVDDRDVRSSSGSDMSLDDSDFVLVKNASSRNHQPSKQIERTSTVSSFASAMSQSSKGAGGDLEPFSLQHLSRGSSLERDVRGCGGIDEGSLSSQRFSRESSVERDEKAGKGFELGSFASRYFSRESSVDVDEQGNKGVDVSSFSSQRFSRESSAEREERGKRLDVGSFSSLHFSRDSSLDRDDRDTRIGDGLVDEREVSKIEETGKPPTEPGHVRRLSVQDRIHLFESKQKEKIGDPGRSKAPGLKGESRRLSSDSSTVFRRWSGASDMSIESNVDKEGPSTSSAVSVQPDAGVSGAQCIENFPADQQNSSMNSMTGSSTSSEHQLTVKDGRPKSSHKLQIQSSQDTISTSPTTISDFDSKVEFLCNTEEVSTEAASENSFAFSTKAEDAGLQKIPMLQVQAKKTKPPMKSQIGIRSSKRDHGNTVAAKEAQSSALQIGAAGTAGTNAKDLSASSQKRRSESVVQGSLRLGESLSSDLKAQDRETAEEAIVSQCQLGAAFNEDGEERTYRDFKLKRHFSVPNESDALLSENRENLSSLPAGDSNTQSAESYGSNPGKLKDALAVPPEPNQGTKQSKGNQELNDELQIKADELEALFAAHKLRMPGEQSSSTGRRSKAMDERNIDKRPSIPSITSHFHDKMSLEMRNEISRNLGMSLTDFDSNTPVKVPSNVVGVLEDSRGKFYDIYKQKRDTKLKEESAVKRAQKEAKLKAMHDSLEKSRVEMEAKFGGSSIKQNSSDRTLFLREKPKPSKARSATKSRDLSEDLGKEENFEDGSYGDRHDERKMDVQEIVVEALVSDGSLKSNQAQRLLHSKNAGLGNLKTFAGASSRTPASKLANSGAIRQSVQQENLLSQSVPNFSDFRKENAKPSIVTNRSSTHSQPKSYSRSKSSKDEVVLGKDDKERRSQSMRKSSINSVELKDVSPHSSDTTTIRSLRLAKDETEQNFYNKLVKNSDSKPFLRKGSGKGGGTGPGLAKLTSAVADSLSTVEDTEETLEHLAGIDEYVDDIDGGVEESPRLSGSFHVRLDDDDKACMSHESEKSGIFEYENSDLFCSMSQAIDLDASLSKASAHFSPLVMSARDSLGEDGALSWNSRPLHSGAYGVEISDMEASVDSPVDSPASWNYHPLSHMMEVEAARMRKKWGSAEKPVLVASALPQSRKDGMKGLKRLLKFGRKSRGSESFLNDWVSASTASEGDDDTEDGRDVASRSSEDLRKSRMGFPSSLNYDSFGGGDLFQEHASVQSLRTSIPGPPANFKLRDDHLSGTPLKAPRSFFSFMSKGAESKAR